MDNLSFYPTLTEDLLDKCGCVCNKYDFSYLIEGAYRSLRPRGKNTIKLEDSLESWKIEMMGCGFAGRLQSKRHHVYTEKTV